jgi:hypothetical protein
MAHEHYTVTAYTCMGGLEVSLTEMTSADGIRSWRTLGHTSVRLPASGRVDEAWVIETIGTWLWTLSETVRGAAF